MPRPGWPSKYRRGYMTRDYHVTGGHEAEAEVAQRSKKPNRLGVAILKILGFRGSVPNPGPKTVSPRHEKVHPPEKPGDT